MKCKDCCYYSKGKCYQLDMGSSNKPEPKNPTDTCNWMKYMSVCPVCKEKKQKS
jgi:hypothetical protein